MRSTHRGRTRTAAFVSMAASLLVAYPLLSLSLGFSSPGIALSSAAGSELPWWTPLAVSLLLVSISLLYRWREHRNIPPDAMDEKINGDEGPPGNEVGGNGGHAPGPARGAFAGAHPLG